MVVPDAEHIDIGLNCAHRHCRVTLKKELCCREAIRDVNNTAASTLRIVSYTEQFLINLFIHKRFSSVNMKPDT